MSRLDNIFNSRLFKDSGIYTISSFVNASIPFALVPILTRKLSTEDYGIIAMFQVVIAFIYPFISVNMEGAVARQFYNNTKIKFEQYVGNSIIVSVISFSVFLFLPLFFNDLFIKITFLNEFWQYLAIICCFFQFLTTLVLTLWQVEQKPIKYGSFQIGLSFLNFVLTILLVVVFSYTWHGRILAQLLSFGVFFLIALLILKNRKIELKLNFEYIKDALKFGAPLIPHAIGGMLLTMIDRFFLTKYFGLSATGNYSVAFQIAMVISLLTISFNNAYVPWLYSNLNKNDRLLKIKIVRLTYFYFIGLSLLAILFILFSPLLFYFFVGSAFDRVDEYFVWIVLGFVFQGFYLMVTNYIMFAKKTSVQALITISVALIKIPIMLLCIKVYGTKGVAIAFCISYFLFFVATWVLSNKVYNMPWKKALYGNIC